MTHGGPSLISVVFGQGHRASGSILWVLQQREEKIPTQHELLSNERRKCKNAITVG